MSDPRIETVVFAIEDPTATTPFWDAFKSRGCVYGMRPISCSIGNRVDVPGEIVDQLAEMDPFCPDWDELTLLIAAAQKHVRKT